MCEALIARRERGRVHSTRSRLFCNAKAASSNPVAAPEEAAFHVFMDRTHDRRMKLPGEGVADVTLDGRRLALVLLPGISCDKPDLGSEIGAT